MQNLNQSEIIIIPDSYKSWTSYMFSTAMCCSPVILKINAFKQTTPLILHSI